MVFAAQATLESPLVTSDALIRDALTADWACYTKPQDRADLSRLSHMIQTFPSGFRVYYAISPDGTRKPVGYTGWYPISAEVFAKLHDTPQEITHRGQIIALPSLATDKNYIYLFNYSIVSELHKTDQSRMLVKNYAAEVRAVPNLGGIAAVTVSPQGKSVAEKFGLSYRGQMTHDGDIEDVYAAYF